MIFPHRVLGISIMVMVALLAWSCGGDDDDEDVDSTATQPAAVATSASTPMTVVDPCTTRVALDGAALSTGEAAAIGPARWQLCLGGVAAGSGEKYLFGSDDAGATWTLLSMTTLGNPPPEAGVGELPNGNAAEALFFIDAQNGWLGLSSPGANLFRTADGGVTWSEAGSLPPGLPVQEISFTDAQTGTLTTPDGEWTTSDGGTAWTQAP